MPLVHLFSRVSVDSLSPAEALRLLPCQIQVCNLQRQFFGIDIRAVGSIENSHHAHHPSSLALFRAIGKQ